MKRLRFALQGIALACVLVLGSHAWAQEPAESIQRFVERKDQWPALVGASFVIEGRVGRVAVQTGVTTLQFERCDLNFRLAPGVPSLPRDTVVAEVSGSIVREDAKLLFNVTGVKKLDSDLATLRVRRGRLANKPEAWFDLADWALERGTFYQDDALKAQADDLRINGLTQSSRRLRSDDYQGLLDLAKRANQWRLDESLGWKFTHDACLIELKKADPTMVLNRVRTSLPSADVQLQPGDEPLRQEYERNRVATYAMADVDKRRKLHRALFVGILLSTIEKDAAPDGRNGYSIAARISQQIPELDFKANEYREKEIGYLRARLPSLTRSEVLDLSSKLVGQKKPTDAVQVKRDWLRAKEPSARTQGPRGMMQLADDYVELLKDDSTAKMLYQDAWLANPKAPEPTAWLSSHGMVLDGNQWVPKSSAPRVAEDRYAQAIQEGRVTPGMSSDQARAALGARPTSIVRQAARGKVSELWIYRNEGLVVSLVRDTGETTAKVESVSSIADDEP